MIKLETLRRLDRFGAFRLAICLVVFTLPLLAQYSPTNISVSPSSGTGNPQTFQFSASSPLGYGDIGDFQVIFNYSLTATNGCYLYYSPASNWISLANDANNAWVGGGNVGGSGTLANSQCQLNLSTSLFAGSGNTGILTVNWLENVPICSVALTFTPAFLGEKNIYLATVEANTGMNTGWQQMGTFSSQLPPVNISVSPANGTGTIQIFQFTASAAAGWADIGTFQIIFNSALTAVNGCYLYYTPAANLLAIANDQNTAWLAGANLGNSNTMGNDQCQVNVPLSSFSSSGNNATLTLAINFLPRLSGAINIYMATGEAATGMNTGWQQMGTWTTTPATYQGSLDVVNCSLIAGWAENANQINSALTVDFRVDGANSPAFSATANEFRQDLLNAGIGTGYYAFNLLTPAALQDGNTHSVAAYYATSGIQLSGSPKTVQCGTAPPGSISVNTNTAGLLVTVDGTNQYTTPFTLTDGQSHTFSVPSPQTRSMDGPGIEYVFANWSDGGGNPRTISPGTNVAVNFSKYYQFTAISSPAGGGSIAVGTLNSQGVVSAPFSSVASGCLTGWWCPAGTASWITGQASTGYGFISLSNGLLQQGIVMNGPITVTANFSTNVLTVSTSSTPQLAPGTLATAHYSGSSTSGNGTTYNGGYGSDGTTLGSFSCYSVIAQIDMAISNINNSGNNISFDVAFLAGANAAPGEYEMTCSCNYFECFINAGPIIVEPPAAPIVAITGPLGIPVGGSDAFNLSVSGSTNNTPIVLTLTTASNTTGSATFTNGTTSMTISSTQNVTVNGVQVSSTANNFTISASWGGEPLASQQFSVVSVSISLNTGTLSTDDTKSTLYQTAVVSGGPLGMVILKTPVGAPPASQNVTCNVGTELIGKVTPKNYTGTVTLQRKWVSGAVYANSTNTGDTFSGSDNSNLAFEVTTPTSLGNIFDLDGPGINGATGVILSARYNFLEYPVLAGTANQVVGNQFATGLAYYVRTSCDAGPVFDTTYPGDNQAGVGTTPITYNLH